jgi:glycosidase
MKTIAQGAAVATQFRAIKNPKPEVVTSLEQVDLTPAGTVHPSPADWGDQLLYFLLPDRFSDAKEDGRPLFDRENPDASRPVSVAEWMRSGSCYQGGNIRGIKSKLDYLKSLGITTLWIAPVWKQRADMQTYHGYGVQNFLEVDPRLGSKQELRSLIDAAHERGMYVLLDIIYNHTGNNWFYDNNGSATDTMPYQAGPPYPMKGWRSKTGECVEKCDDPETGVWPIEFQNPEWYSRAGTIEHWDDPGKELSADAEFRRGDFGNLKDLELEKGEVIDAVIKVYQYWIAFSDCDGFRIDTVKHVPPEVSAIFCHNIRSFARKLGKDNFLLLGEVTGSAHMVRTYVDPKGPNLDAVLDIESAPRRLGDMVKGLTPPVEFFDHFGGRDEMGEVRNIGRHHVSVLDDHDMVWRDGKHRFAWNNETGNADLQNAHAEGVQLTTPGIPCIYYGTEQCFTGSESMHDESIEPKYEGRVPLADRYVRESMFGGGFGAFATSGVHFFDPDHPTYLRIAAIARLRNREDGIGQALRRGSLFVRETKAPEEPETAFHGPLPGGIIAWSRIFEGTTVIIVLNTHGVEARTAEITVDSTIHPEGSSVREIYRGDWDEAQLKHGEAPGSVPVKHYPGGRSTITIELPAAGMVILS